MNNTVIKLSKPSFRKVREIIEQTGHNIGCVHFFKRQNGDLRKMCYRLHVRKPSAAPSPKGIKKKDVDKINNQITVFDTNKTIRNDNGDIVGRGAWRTISLEKVVRVSCKGKTYLIER